MTSSKLGSLNSELMLRWDSHFDLILVGLLKIVLVRQVFFE